MIIGFTGAGGTGKSTTAAALSALVGGKLGESPARGVFKKYKIKEADQRNMPIKDLLKLQSDIHEAKIAQDLAVVGSPFEECHIFDRTPIDTAAYTMYRCGPGITEQASKALVAQVADHMRYYHLVFYTPLVEFPEADKFRETGYGYNYCIDTIIRELIWRTQVAVTTLPIMPQEERATLATKCLNDTRDQLIRLQTK